MFRSSTDEVSTSGAEASESGQTSETGRRSGNALSLKESTNFSEESVPSSSSHQRVEDETTSASHGPLLSSGDVVLVAIYANTSVYYFFLFFILFFTVSCFAKRIKVS